jgi:hypothetical protein
MCDGCMRCYDEKPIGYEDDYDLDEYDYEDEEEEEDDD